MRSAHPPEPCITTTGMSLFMAFAAVASVFSSPSNINSTTGTPIKTVIYIRTYYKK